MSLNIAGGIVALALLGLTIFGYERDKTPVVTPVAVKSAPVVSVPPLERQPVTIKTLAKKGGAKFSAPGHRVFYLVGDDKLVHYCYEVPNLPGLTVEETNAALAQYGETAPAGKLATGFICL